MCDICMSQYDYESGRSRLAGRVAVWFVYRMDGTWTYYFTYSVVGCWPPKLFTTISIIVLVIDFNSYCIS